MESEDRIVDAIERTAVPSPAETRAFDELERSLEDIADPRLRADLQRLVSGLERQLVESQRRFLSIDVHRHFDPIRIVMCDLEAGFS